MNINELLSENFAIMGTIDPANNTSAYSDYVDMAKFSELCAILLTGDMSAHTIDFALYGYTDQAAGNETEIKAITQLDASATTHDGAQAIISLRPEDLVAKDGTTTRAAGGLRYVRAKITSGSQTGYSAAVLLGRVLSGLPSAQDLSTVAEIETDRS
jgi:hypothetical protein